MAGFQPTWVFFQDSESVAELEDDGAAGEGGLTPIEAVSKKKLRSVFASGVLVRPVHDYDVLQMGSCKRVPSGQAVCIHANSDSIIVSEVLQAPIVLPISGSVALRCRFACMHGPV